MRSIALATILLAGGCQPGDDPNNQPSVMSTEASEKIGPSHPCRGGSLVMAFEGPFSGHIVCGSSGVDLMSISFANDSTCDMEVNPGNYSIAVEDGMLPANVIVEGHLEDQDGTWLSSPELIDLGRLAFDDVFDLNAGDTEVVNLVADLATCPTGMSTSIQVTYKTPTTRAEFLQTGRQVRNLVPTVDIVGNPLALDSEEEGIEQP